MDKDIIKFMDNVDIREETSKYKDSKGNVLYIPTNALYPTCSYLTLTEEEYQQALFKGQVKKDNYNKVKEKRPVSKDKVTGKEEDKLTIVEKEVEVYQIWVVSNQFGFTHSFRDIDEAVDFVEDIESELKEVA